MANTVTSLNYANTFGHWVTATNALVNENNILATTTAQKTKYCCAVIKSNIIGTQFHPEKSGKSGLRLIKNWVESL